MTHVTRTYQYRPIRVMKPWPASKSKFGAMLAPMSVVRSTAPVARFHSYTQHLPSSVTVSLTRATQQGVAPDAPPAAS